MFSVLSPFVWAAAIGKPVVLLFQRPGSVDSEVILGPSRRAWELGGGCWADKNQTWLRQEHVELHTQKHVLCTCVIYRTYHSKYTKICRQADVLSCTGIHIFKVCEPASTQTEEMHTYSSRKCKDAINYSAQNNLLKTQIQLTLSWCGGELVITEWLLSLQCLALWPLLRPSSIAHILFVCFFFAAAATAAHFRGSNLLHYPSTFSLGASEAFKNIAHPHKDFKDLRIVKCVSPLFAKCESCSCISLNTESYFWIRLNWPGIGGYYIQHQEQQFF